VNNQPISPEVIAEAQALLAFAMSTPREIADIFVDYSSHVRRLYVQVYLGGWREGLPKDIDDGEYLDSESSLEGIQGMRLKVEGAVAQYRENPRPIRQTDRAKSLREAAQKLMAEAESLTTSTVAQNPVEHSSV
jgi:hypothetical protein